MLLNNNILSIKNFSLNFKTKERNVIANQDINLNDKFLVSLFIILK